MKIKKVSSWLLLIVIICSIIQGDLEPNDEFNNAEQIGSGTYNGEVFSYIEGERDYFEISVPKDRYLNIKIDADFLFDNSLFVVLSFEEEIVNRMKFNKYDHYDHVLSWENNIGEEVEINIVLLSYDSCNYQMIVSIDLEKNSNPVSVRVPNQESEPNDDYDQSQSIEEGIIEGRIESSPGREDDDLYKITIPPHSTIAVNLTLTGKHYYEPFYDPRIDGDINEEVEIRCWINEESKLNFDKEIDSISNTAAVDSLWFRRIYQSVLYDENEKDYREGTFKNDQDSEVVWYILIEGEGNYSLEIDIEEDEKFIILDYLPLIISGIIILIVIVGVIIIIRKVRKRKS